MHFTFEIPPRSRSQRYWRACLTLLLASSDHVETPLSSWIMTATFAPGICGSSHVAETSLLRCPRDWVDSGTVGHCAVNGEGTVACERDGEFAVTRYGIKL
jgi:hypothetical protein